MTAIRRRSLFLLPLLAAGCAGSPPPRAAYPPLQYGYLRKLPLNVATVDVDDQAATAPVAGGEDIAGLSPVPPAQALAAMARDRLQAVGSAGRAVFVIGQAQILRGPDGLDGQMRVRLDVLTGNGITAAYAQAEVSRVLTGDVSDPRAAAYDLTRQMMADMNVEFEYQVRHALRDWLVPDGVAGGAGRPGAVDAQPLPPPGA